MKEEELGNPPPLYSQSTARDPIIYARLVAPGLDWACYVAEAGISQNGDLTIYGLFLNEGRHWGQISVREVETSIERRGSSLRIDKQFKPTTVSELVGRPC